MEERPPPLPTPFTRHAGVELPVVCGAMYPCSNPELVAAVSEAGGLGVVQPISLTYVHGWELRAGLRYIRGLTSRPVGFNVIVEHTTRAYERRLREWVEIALEEGVRFFVTALGRPDWVCAAVHAAGGVVYHDVTERRWALRALEGGVDGLVCVNRDAGGHAGQRSAEELYAELADLGVPLLCAGGVGDPEAFVRALRLGYAGVQMGTRFLASTECRLPEAYRQAILQAGAEDIVHTVRLSGIPCAVIRTPAVERLGLDAGPVARRLLRTRRGKRWVRTWYAIRAMRSLKQGLSRGLSHKDVFQAGRSVAGIHEILPAAEILRRFAAAAQEAGLYRGGEDSEPRTRATP